MKLVLKFIKNVSHDVHNITLKGQKNCLTPWGSDSLHLGLVHNEDVHLECVTNLKIVFLREKNLAVSYGIVIKSLLFPNKSLHMLNC